MVSCTYIWKELYTEEKLCTCFNNAIKTQVVTTQTGKYREFKKIAPFARTYYLGTMLLLLSTNGRFWGCYDHKSKSHPQTLMRETEK